MDLSLVDKMMARADADGLPPDHEIRLSAQKLDEALTADFNVARVVGSWARARKIWCEYTGEPLV